MNNESVKAWRQNKEMTQEQAAEWLGISWRQFQRLESGDSKVSGPIARLIKG
jgi:DNA-binding transcriptional regulator YiaG